ncbi:MAG: PadR family transcriptional regulator [Gemmatimonadales bacterium]
MADRSPLGEFEQLVLLAILRLAPEAHAPAVRGAIETAGRRSVTRGALYATLDRLETKGFLTWCAEAGPAARAGVPRRIFTLTPAGLRALRRSYQAVSALAEGLERQLGST